MSDNYSNMRSVRYSPEHIDMLIELQSKLSGVSQSTILRWALEDYYQKNKDGVSSSNKAITLDAKIQERMTGDALGSFDKERDKIAAIEKAFENGDIKADRAKKLISDVKYNFARSREAMWREYDNMVEAAKTKNEPDLASIISKRMQEEQKKADEPYNPCTDPSAWVFYHCGIHWQAKNRTDKCKNCGEMVEGNPKW